MTTYTDHRQRELDQASGRELDKRAAGQSPIRFRVTYRYEDQSGRGPTRGRDIVNRPYAKGERIYAMFGWAVVKTCSVQKEDKS